MDPTLRSKLPNNFAPSPFYQLMKKKIAFIHTKHYSMQLFLFHGDVLLELHNPTIFLSLISAFAPERIFPTVSSTRPQFFSMAQTSTSK